jgi:hypothetical protein
MRRKIARWAAALLLASGSATASEQWQFGGTLYLWAAGIQGETPRGVDFDVDFGTVLGNLNMAFMGTLEARRGPWSLLADAVYMNVGASDGASVAVPAAGVTVDVDGALKVRGLALNLLGSYTVWASEQASLDVLGGVRYLELDTEVDLRLNALGRQLAPSRSALGTAWDGIVGVKGQVKLDDRWYLPYYADIGAGESNLTWQVFAGVGYAFDWGEVSLVYRHLEWDFDADEKLEHVRFSGPAAAVTWRF